MAYHGNGSMAESSEQSQSANEVVPVTQPDSEVASVNVPSVELVSNSDAITGLDHKYTIPGPPSAETVGSSTLIANKSDDDVTTLDRPEKLLNTSLPSLRNMTPRTSESDGEDTCIVATDFVIFSQLPLEIRQMIWKEACFNDPRVIDIFLVQGPENYGGAFGTDICVTYVSEDEDVSDEEEKDVEESGDEEGGDEEGGDEEGWRRRGWRRRGWRRI
ncbi:uncharacterized protein LY89DRAFT_506244 [Mollisia scopiformis]|uniref:2EXR domain-containing protein n=1 Tax=Mollisia scopiformis TaxID=149040 RepID=A0A194XFA7_MOLSC|nr:uncharacterized protein LY89DRAFT_506244 [Mollisia scopiformis]KUJ18853.1 hypothetical protein LY89DRAFT_506244 [Mollisia scopiformis]